MILFLTLCYCALLFILVKIGIIKLNSFWKASPLIWMTLLLIFLFIPMNWGAPSGPIMQHELVVSITPNVAGEVIDVSALANQPMKKGDVLFRLDPTSYQAAVDQLESSLELSQTRLGQSQRLAERGAGSAYDVQRYRAEVLSYKAQLASARWNLESCTVSAPDDGIPMPFTLSPGNRVSNAAAVMAYGVVKKKMVVGISQAFVRHVEVGQPVEFTMKILPGEILTGAVVGTVMMTPQGQLAPSGQVPLAPTGQQAADPIGVFINPSEETMTLFEKIGGLPGGATGTAAIYTESAEYSQIIRKIMLRLEMWMNFVVPG